MSDTNFEDSVGVPAISVERVRKAYGATVAVDDASFSIARGAVHALLGENGAGKSTIVKLLSGLTQPDSGGLRLFGEPVRLASPRDSQAPRHPDRVPGNDAGRRPDRPRQHAAAARALGPDRNDPPPSGAGAGRRALRCARHERRRPRRRDRRARPRRPAEDRDRAGALPQAAHPAARRADLDPLRARRRLARRNHRSGYGPRA